MTPTPYHGSGRRRRIGGQCDGQGGACRLVERVFRRVLRRVVPAVTLLARLAYVTRFTVGGAGVSGGCAGAITECRYVAATSGDTSDGVRSGEIIDRNTVYARRGGGGRGGGGRGGGRG